MLPAELGFDAEATEIIAPDQVEVDSRVVVQNDCIVDVFDDFDIACRFRRGLLD